ncbi:MAG: TIGR00725 family protein [Cyanobacteria bacterium 13_1_40CM_2_61_4]|nr:MAG: TIGR00725 family protein [Cyanobacteria bacterium 13_1_40CM_2_61_4]
MDERKPIIAVIGGSNTASPEAIQLAEEVGFLIARADAVVVCGGLNGVMEAACKGAKRGGGLTVGILPGSDPRDANPHVDVPVVTAISTARNAIVVRTGDAIIAIDGSYGTLTEMAYAFDLGKKVFGLRSWDLEKVGVPKSLYVPVKTPREAVDRALEEAMRHHPAER